MSSALFKIKNIPEELAYYFSFPDADLKDLDMHIQEGLYTLNRLNEIAKKAGDEKTAGEAEKHLATYYELFMTKVYDPEG